MRSSTTADRIIARSSRYAFATVEGPGFGATTRWACQFRTTEGEIAVSSSFPSLGRI